jgi:Cys-tRNA(Pro)/Cys-tRNA(Cys) deacylase
MPTKTNAIRILDANKIAYRAYAYKSKGKALDGITVASLIDVPIERVYKKLVTQGASRAYYVYVVPVACELNLKAAAAAVEEKSVRMVPQADLLKVTGYVRGGCSPIGMKKAYRTTIDESCLQWDKVVISAGKIGLQIGIAPADLTKLLVCETAELV